MGSRPLLALVFVALILFGLSRSFELSRPDRGKGTWQEIPTLKERDDLNLVVVVVDTLRADRLSAYGYERPTSPILEALSQSGIRFENTLSQSTWTKTSMASMLTATYPAKNRITRFNHIVPSGATLPSEIFKQAGFRTVGLWRNLWVAPEFGFHQGYDVYVKPRGVPQDAAANPSAGDLAGTDQQLVETAAQFLRTVGDERFFLYVHLMDVHQYVYGEGVQFGTTYSDIYDQSIHLTDQMIGTLIAVLQQEGLMKHSIVAIVSDHGEAFYEHGQDGHAKDLYAETTHVPFIVLLPFQLEEPIVVKSPVENIDVFPTLLDLLGMPPLPEADGHSLVPLILAAARGEEAPASDGLRFADLDQNWGRPTRDPKPLVLVDDGQYRMHAVRGEKPELYDTSQDAMEQEDVARSHPEVIERLADAVRSYAAVEHPSWGGPGWVEIDEVDARALRALGYAFDPHAPPSKREIHQ